MFFPGMPLEPPRAGITAVTTLLRFTTSMISAFALVAEAMSREQYVATRILEQSPHCCVRFAFRRRLLVDD